MVGENLFFYVLTSDTEYIEPVDKYFFFFGLSYTLHSVVASNFDIHFDLCFSLELFHWHFSLMVYKCVYIWWWWLCRALFLSPHNNIDLFVFTFTGVQSYSFVSMRIVECVYWLVSLEPRVEFSWYNRISWRNDFVMTASMIAIVEHSSSVFVIWVEEST